MSTSSTAHCQRWRDRRDSYRPAGEPIRTSLYEVARITTDTEPREFVERHHYEGSYPAALDRFGLYRGTELVGVAVLSQPASQAALEAALPFPGERRAELGRFVLLDDVPANGESWFLAQCFDLARRAGFAAVVAHSDPEARTTTAGDLVFPGHIGTIYQATNAVYVGRTPARTRRMLADGHVFSDRKWSKLRARERGHEAAVRDLVRLGVAPPHGDWEAWVLDAVRSVSTPFRHRGNHRYLWALDRRLRRRLPAAQPYPKFSLLRSAS